MGPWTDFFERDLPALTRNATASLRDAVVKYSTDLGAIGHGDRDIAELLQNVLPDLASDVNEAVDAALAVAQKSIETETQRRQQDLHRITEDAIVAGMKPVFARAAAERGTGMKQRMNQHLESGSANAVRKACELVQSRLAETASIAMNTVLAGLDPVAKRIVDKSDKMTLLLGEHQPTQSGPSLDDVTKLLGKVSKTRGVVNAPIRFATGRPKFKTESVGVAETSGPKEHQDQKVVLIDASNVARNAGLAPDISRLQTCLRAARAHFNGYQVTLIADASLSRITERESSAVEFSLLKTLISDNDLVLVPPGSPGKADKYILDLASTRTAIVVSNDSFREFQGDHPWLFDEGRLFGHGEVPGVGWNFTVRFPVRPRIL